MVSTALGTGAGIQASIVWRSAISPQVHQDGRILRRQLRQVQQGTHQMNRALTDSERRLLRNGQLMRSLGTQGLYTFTAIAGAVVGLISKTTELAEEMQVITNTSERLGVSFDA